MEEEFGSLPAPAPERSHEAIRRSRIVTRTDGARPRRNRSNRRADQFIEEVQRRMFMKRYPSWINIALLSLVLLAIAALPAWGRPRPFHLKEHGTATFNADGTISSDGTGTATHLGKFTLRRTAKLTPSRDGGDATVEGEALLTAANGDLLKASITGTFNPATGAGVLIYQWQGGTGRFQNATGTSTWLVELYSDLTYDVVADGVIDY
jgi:hypothetical protein